MFTSGQDGADQVVSKDGKVDAELTSFSYHLVGAPVVQVVYPSDAEVDLLLGDPAVALAKHFPLEAANPNERPEGVAEEYSGPLHRRMAWKNHCYGVRTMVMELHAQATGKPLLKLLHKQQ